ncbi:hypothetical protein PTSG_12031 [Salpingoeca rosetta]|uniref:Uncharacterized protein n=1 Tax=Salpingoeca rosetta (strain ATCC 50818 / BSB-021) TaxID=946362 RepID=F2U5S5_SALR5|nr:uncharacterized protein PTSG_12031 [Salpingoeca rosetta]EGD82866.1 hypothetical protein PTSG_12031 [Salpingoeca rosetta]|eukprot:XP_004995230.1 hypothetical protein PTSG_12031 [Salpingoeca rosetta]
MSRNPEINKLIPFERSSYQTTATMNLCDLVHCAYVKNMELSNDDNRPLCRTLLQRSMWKDLQRAFSATDDEEALAMEFVLPESFRNPKPMYGHGAPQLPLPPITDHNNNNSTSRRGSDRSCASSSSSPQGRANPVTAATAAAAVVANATATSSPSSSSPLSTTSSPSSQERKDRQEEEEQDADAAQVYFSTYMY